ncbi:SUMO-activating enzyme subunit 1 [Palaemon carinicauda]|uniref:SUMO-activating enzyme subunit 1 n=1 Tax=Palaemon carinicauda TaxID=392227 RepID=UPI0035B60AFA
MNNSAMKVVDKTTDGITEDEAELYDRQIRLWGLDAQKRLRGSRILVAGLCGMGAEVTKNLVLAGVKSVVLLDHREVTEIDTFSNFLAAPNSVGQNIASASEERAQALNPMVDVVADPTNIEEKTEEFFKDFDVVFLSRCKREQLLRINNICRMNGVVFLAGDVFGQIGYMFSDLLDHSYADEVKEKVEVPGQSQTVEETRIVRREESFIPLSQALDVDWTTPKYASQLRRTSPAYFIMQVMMEFVMLHGRLPDPSRRDEDVVEILTIKNALMDKMNIPPEKVKNDFAEYVFGQLSPVCAILGGVAAQEIIKAVSQKDAPLKNFFFFNTLEGAGIVECIGH